MATSNKLKSLIHLDLLSQPEKQDHPTLLSFQNEAIFSQNRTFLFDRVIEMCEENSIITLLPPKTSTKLTLQLLSWDYLKENINSILTSLQNVFEHKNISMLLFTQKKVFDLLNKSKQANVQVDAFGMLHIQNRVMKPVDSINIEEINSLLQNQIGSIVFEICLKEFESYIFVILPYSSMHNKLVSSICGFFHDLHISRRRHRDNNITRLLAALMPAYGLTLQFLPDLRDEIHEKETLRALHVIHKVNKLQAGPMKVEHYAIYSIYRNLENIKIHYYELINLKLTSSLIPYHPGSGPNDPNDEIVRLQLNAKKITEDVINNLEERFEIKKGLEEIESVLDHVDQEACIKNNNASMSGDEDQANKDLTILKLENIELKKRLEQALEYNYNQSKMTTQLFLQVQQAVFDKYHQIQEKLQSQLDTNKTLVEINSQLLSELKLKKIKNEQYEALIYELKNKIHHLNNQVEALHKKNLSENKPNNQCIESSNILRIGDMISNSLIKKTERYMRNSEIQYKSEEDRYHLPGGGFEFDDGIVLTPIHANMPDEFKKSIIKKSNLSTLRSQFSDLPDDPTILSIIQSDSSRLNAGFVENSSHKMSKCESLVIEDGFFFPQKYSNQKSENSIKSEPENPIESDNEEAPQALAVRDLNRRLMDSIGSPHKFISQTQIQNSSPKPSITSRLLYTRTNPLSKHSFTKKLIENE